jgi:hypothetical protein
MTEAQPIGPVLHSFFADHLITVKGLRPASVHSYRDTIRLLLTFAAADKGCKITRLTLGDLSFDRIVRFLRYLEAEQAREVTLVEFARADLAAALQVFDDIRSRSRIIYVSTPASVRQARLADRAVPPDVRVDGQTITLSLQTTTFCPPTWSEPCMQLTAWTASRHQRTGATGSSRSTTNLTAALTWTPRSASSSSLSSAHTELAAATHQDTRSWSPLTCEAREPRRQSPDCTNLSVQPNSLRGARSLPGL